MLGITSVCLLIIIATNSYALSHCGEGYEDQQNSYLVSYNLIVFVHLYLGVCVCVGVFMHNIVRLYNTYVCYIFW